MVVATHRIGIEAKINNAWGEKKIREYCIKKLGEIDDIWYPRLESVEINQKTVKAHVLIHSTYYDFIKYKEDIGDDVKTWVEDHITEPGLIVLKIGIKPLGRSIEDIGEGGKGIYL